MYLVENQIESASLVQGDIISGVHILGALNLTSIHYSQDARGKPSGWSVYNAPIMGDVMVVSHSCEIARENGMKVTSIILAPIRDINGATSPAKVQELIESNLISTGVHASYLKYFYIEPHDKLEFRNGGVVDFSKCFSVRKNSYDHLLERKVLQLNPEIADLMALKYGLYFHRNSIPA